jgi:hypothetical protein
MISEIYRNQTDGGIYGSLLWREFCRHLHPQYL